MPCCLELQPLRCPVAVVSRGHSSADTASLGIACGFLIPKYSNLWLLEHNICSPTNSCPSTMAHSPLHPPRCGRRGRQWYCSSVKRGMCGVGMLREASGSPAASCHSPTGPKDHSLAPTSLWEACCASLCSGCSLMLVGSFSHHLFCSIPLRKEEGMHLSPCPRAAHRQTVEMLCCSDSAREGEEERGLLLAGFPTASTRR